MWFYKIEEDVSAPDRALVGYFHYHYDAYQKFMESKDYTMLRLELKDGKYSVAQVWEHTDDEEDF